MTQVEERKELGLEKILELQKKITKWKRRPIITSNTKEEYAQHIIYEGKLVTEGQTDLTICLGSCFIINKDERFFKFVNISATDSSGYPEMYTSFDYNFIDRFKKLNDKFNEHLEKSTYELEIQPF